MAFVYKPNRTPPGKRGNLFKAGNSRPQTKDIILNLGQNPKDQLHRQAEAYHRAGKVLVGRYKTLDGHPDFEAYPIVFLYRHSIELFFKSILLLGTQLGRLLDEELIQTPESKLFSGHGLRCHLPTLKAIFAVVGWEEAWEKVGFAKDEFETIITELDKVDPQSFAFRYTLNKDGTSSLPPHFSFDLLHFATVLNEILDNLSGACLGLQECINAQIDYMSSCS